MTDAGSEILRVSEVTKRFRGTTALDGATMSIDKGEFVGLLGPNGAGKTTLIRAISGHVRVNSGSITLFGRPLRSGLRNHIVADGIGAVPQELAIYPTLTARENLEVFGAFHAMNRKAIQERVDWALQWSDLKERCHEPVKQFSTGMKRRLNIACGILHDPPFVLLDEPTVGVDPQARERIWQMLAALREGGTTLLLTTHQLEEAENLCDRIIIIDGGRSIAEGSFDELVEKTIGSNRVLEAEIMLTDQQIERLPEQWQYDKNVVRIQVVETLKELPGVIEQLKSLSTELGNVHLKRPSLHDVFLHLTGRELRE